MRETVRPQVKVVAWRPRPEPGNPFIGPESDLVIVSVDTLAPPRCSPRLHEAGGPGTLRPRRLRRGPQAVGRARADLRVRKTDRYKLAEALAGVQGRAGVGAAVERRRHLLLLTATPHMGKDYPYFACGGCWSRRFYPRTEAFDAYPPERARTALHPPHQGGDGHASTASASIPSPVSDTLGYELTQGAVSEQALYDETTDYIRDIYNRAPNAEPLRRAAGDERLPAPPGQFDLRLMRSFERRLAKLDDADRRCPDGRLDALSKDQRLAAGTAAR